MKNLRWYVKQDGTKTLQSMEPVGPSSFRFVDVPTEYESPLAKYNETASFKVKNEDIKNEDIEILVIGDKRCITIKHIPTGLKVKVDGIFGTFAEREDLLKQLLDQIKQCHEKINS